MMRSDESDSFAAMEARISAHHARERRRQERLARAERRDLIQRERAQARALARSRPGKQARQVAALTRRIAELRKNGDGSN